MPVTIICFYKPPFQSHGMCQDGRWSQIITDLKAGICRLFDIMKHSGIRLHKAITIPSRTAVYTSASRTVSRAAARWVTRNLTTHNAIH